MSGRLGFGLFLFMLSILLLLFAYRLQWGGQDAVAVIAAAVGAVVGFVAASFVAWWLLEDYHE